MNVTRLRIRRLLFIYLLPSSSQNQKGSVAEKFGQHYRAQYQRFRGDHMGNDGNVNILIQNCFEIQTESFRN
jgi:hypothetical protein